MKCKIISGTRNNSEEQLQKVLDNAESVVSMATSPSNSNGVIITIIYIPKTVANVTQTEYTK